MKFIVHDLENSPLQIKTDSADGSDEYVAVMFYTADPERYNAGEVSLRFTSPPQYELFSCGTPWTNFPTSLPTETAKIWTITLTRTSGTVSVIIHCNNKEVLNLVLSDTTCSTSYWSTIWSRDVEQIDFERHGTASDYYRPGKQVNFISCILQILL